MRVIAGEKKGLTLKTIEGMDTRPTLDRVKESFFSSIQFELKDRIVLDLFSGSGSLGIEALSRSAKSCTFVDESKKCCDIIKENLNHTGFAVKSEVIQSTIELFLSRVSGLSPYTIVFMDPPYRMGLIQKSLDLLYDKLKKDTIIVAEYEKNAIIDLKDHYGLRKKLDYKINEVSILVKK